MDFNSFSYFEKRSPKEHSCEVWLKLAWWFRRRCCLKKLLTDDARRTTDIQQSEKLTMSTTCSGELKTECECVRLSEGTLTFARQWQSKFISNCMRMIKITLHYFTGFPQNLQTKIPWLFTDFSLTNFKFPWPDETRKILHFTESMQFLTTHYMFVDPIFTTRSKYYCNCLQSKSSKTPNMWENFEIQDLK